MKYFEFRVQIPVSDEFNNSRASIEAMNILAETLKPISGAKMGLPKPITELEYKG